MRPVVGSGVRESTMKEYRRRSGAVRRGFDRASKEAFRVVGDFDGCYPDEVGADMPVELYFETGKGEGGYRIFEERRTVIYARRHSNGTGQEPGAGRR
jgi:hypothetical protein